MVTLPSSLRRHGDVLLLGGLLEGALLCLAAGSGLDRGRYLLEVLFWLPFGVYLLAVAWTLLRRHLATPPHTGPLILAFTLAFSLTLP